MSRAYRISVSETLRRHIRVEDGFQVQLELLGILPADQMSELLAQELEPLGFERDGDTMRRVDDDGVEIEVDLQEGSVTARLASDREFDLTVERTRSIEEEVLERGKARLKKDVEAELEEGARKAKNELTAESTKILEQKLRDLRSEMDLASNRTIASALKIRAQQMGEIQEVSENAETGEITIKVQI